MTKRYEGVSTPGYAPAGSGPRRTGPIRKINNLDCR